ncbi:pilus assembly protein [Rhizobium ruizarguesonis]|jgi:Flp pilus assembly protein TadG|uniref:Pilus assembly protein n=1 Tax=Rhizobium ruizarguesonis TaxID=2081791 RepID=A0AAE5C594_9HYPH|nr:TadE/TadG family type IV pilus assembly protein [Rhizobium ruizarguesonis]MBY5807336.1 pilus assembly protein [Rhizobium leguminosarum]NKJ74882.1 pilus assembly protein [Rhizobium leguminosarum bv. viciae]QIO45498.1 pilus assembly protein [Rhizobium leguminosarum bv. trifolii]QJS30178.1 pilus assembly protein [Rhizobium leguminosarum bv. trifolii TA1]MBY5833188.1 pilus assembly protein [Rhizobium leguminosarum]
MALRNPFTRLVLTARRLIRDRKGAGAIEFAILFPVLIMLYIGAFEITIGLSVSKRVTRAAGTVADLITQQQSVTKSALAQMPSVATAIFVPYNSTALTMKITGVTIDASANAKVLWSWAQDGTAPYAKNTTVSNVPSDMKTANSFLVRTELSIPYTMFLFAPNFMPDGMRTITISRSYFYRQRQGDSIPCGDC